MEFIIFTKQVTFALVSRYIWPQLQLSTQLWFSAFGTVLETGNTAVNKIKPLFSWNLHFSRTGAGGRGGGERGE